MRMVFSGGCKVFFLSFAYICVAVGDPIIKRGGLDAINRFNLTTFSSITRDMNWISNVICGRLLLCSVS